MTIVFKNSPDFSTSVQQVELWKLQNTDRFLVLQTDCYVERTKLETV